MNCIFDEPCTLAEQVNAVVEAVERNVPCSIRTSGTTGTPKVINRDLAVALQKKKAGKQSERWLLTYSPERWAGISVILHVLKANATLCIPRSLAFEDLIQGGRAHQVSHLSLTPSMFRSLLIDDRASTLQEIPVLQLTFGGEAATQSVLDLGRKTWPKARITHVYASTESGDICSVSDGIEGVPLCKFERFAFTEHGELVVDGLKTGDIWEKRGSRYAFVGRIQEIINVGGNKVSPIAVEEFAIRCGVRFARAYSIPSALMGALVGLEYIGSLEKTELMMLFRKQLPKYMCPAQITQLDAIGLSDAGKMRRLP